MEQIIYENIMFASFVAMYAYGLFSLVTNSPEGKEYNCYRVSRKIYGSTMIFWASYLVIHWYFHPRLTDPTLAYTLCVSCYFPGAMLLEAAFSSLIDSGFALRRRITKIVIYTLCINAIVFTSYFLLDSVLKNIVLIAMSVAFAIEMLILSRRFILTYRRALRWGDNYYSDNINIFIKWMPQSIYIAIGFGFAGSLLLFATSSAVSVYMFGGLLLFTYIFISYQNYMINITKIKEVLLTNTPEVKITEHKELTTNEHFKDTLKRLDEWVAAKGYTQKGITIEELALKLCTNRTYLSSHINSSYGASFREWIATLRIEYAKKMLLSDEELPSNRIAEIVGYSPNAFTSLFTKVEKMSPVKWRASHKRP